MGKYPVDVKLERLSHEDIPFLLKLSESVGWDYDEQEVESIMSSGVFYGHRTSKGDLVSCGSVIQYDSNLASVGMIIVSPDFRRMGLGMEVTEKCVSSASRNSCKMLVSTEQGRPMYRKVGFREAENVIKLISGGNTSMALADRSNIVIEELSEENISEILPVDLTGFGADRSEFLRMRLRQSLHGYLARASSGNLLGYCLAIGGSINVLIGPLVAVDDNVATVLINEVIFREPGQLRIDVPAGHRKWSDSLLACGFENVAEPFVMTFGGSPLPERDGNLYTLSAQVFG